jgi:hypothetical protein
MPDLIPRAQVPAEVLDHLCALADLVEQNVELQEALDRACEKIASLQWTIHHLTQQVEYWQVHGPRPCPGAPTWAT